MPVSLYLCMSVYLCLSVYVCVYVYLYVCVCLCMSVSLCMCIYMSVCMYACKYVCLSLCVICCSLTPEGKKLLTQYGSSLISKLQFRDNFIMIGQKGLSQGSAIEQVLVMCDVCMSDSSLIHSIFIMLNCCVFILYSYNSIVNQTLQWIPQDRGRLRDNQRTRG